MKPALLLPILHDARLTPRGPMTRATALLDDLERAAADLAQSLRDAAAHAATAPEYAATKTRQAKQLAERVVRDMRALRSQIDQD